MARGPSGATTIWTFQPATDNLNKSGVWERVQNDESAAAGNSLVSAWPTGTATRTTMPAGQGYAGGRGLRFELRSGDVAANGERSEISGDGMSWQFHEGDERWLQWRVKFASNWTPGTANRFNIIMQMHAGTGSPPVAIEVKDDGRLTLQSNGDLPSLEKTILTAAEWTAKKGQWIDINLHLKFSNSDTVGFAEIHVDGVLKVAKHSRRTMSSDRCYLKLGMYRHPQPQTNVLWVDDIRLSSGTQIGDSDPSPVSGAITIPGSSMGENASATSVTVNKPTGTTAGEMLLAVISSSRAGEIPPLPAGWTAIDDWTTSSLASRAFYKIASSSEPASYTFDSGMTVADRVSATVTRVVGFDATNPFDIPADSNHSAATLVNSIDTTPFTTVTPGAMAIYFHIMNSSGTSVTVPPSGVTKIVESGTAGRYQSGWYENVPAIASIPARTFGQSLATTRYMGIYTIVIRPASSGSAAAPTVDAGNPATTTTGVAFTRTAVENNGGSTITSRKWEIVSGPAGAGSTIGTAAALSWTPTTAGSYVLRYSATNVAGTGTDTVAVTVTAPGTISGRTRVQAIGGSMPIDGTIGTNVAMSFSNPPTAGNFLLAVWVVDLDAGAFTPPAGWTVLANRVAPSVSLLVCGKISNGTETGLIRADWTTPQDQANIFLAEYSGVNTTNPYGPNDFPTYVDVQFQDITLNPAAATVDGMALAIIAAANTRTGSDFSPAASGWTNVINIHSTADTSAGIGIMEKLNVVAGEDLNPTFTWTALTRRQGYIMILNAAGATAPPPDTGGGETEPPPPPVGTAPTLNSRVVGFPEVAQARVAVNTNAVRVRLKVGKDPAVTTNVVYGPYATPNAQGDAKLVVGLPASYDAGEWYYRVAMLNAEGGEWLDTKTDVGRLLTAPTGRVGLTVCAGSCTNASDSASMAAIANRQDDLFVHLGDMWYADGSGTTIANYRSKMDAKLRAANHARVFATIPSAYTPSDHDYGMVDDGVGPGTGGTNWNAVFREKWPHPDLPMTGTLGCYWTRPWGTAIRIIVLDTRSFASVGSTKLGSTQKAWFKNVISTMTEDVALIFQDGVWIGGTDAGSDDWQGTLAERNEIGDFIAASGKKVVWFGGDSHAVGGDNGTNSRGGFPVYQCAPLNNTASQKGGPYSAGLYPSSGTASVQQYGRVVITLGATTLTSVYTGYSSDNTVRKTITTTYPAAPAPEQPTGRVFRVWNGTTLVRRMRQRWTGSVLKPVNRT